MKIHETCGCGASIEAASKWLSDIDHAMEAFRRDHRHDSRPPASTESDEDGQGGQMVPEHDPTSTTASQVDMAEPAFGFGGKDVVMTRG